MTGYDIYQGAVALLGYDDRIHFEDDALSDVYLSFANHILSDIGCGELGTSSQEITLTPVQREAVVYGVAMLAAISVADTVKGEEYAKHYRRKRGAALSAVTEISDVLPSAEGE